VSTVSLQRGQHSRRLLFVAFLFLSHGAGKFRTGGVLPDPRLEASTRRVFLLFKPADTRVPLYGQESLPWVEYLALEDELWKVVTGENPMKELLQAATMVLHQGRFEMETFSAIASDFSFFTAYGIAALEHPKDGDKREKMCLALQAEEQPYSGLLESKLPVFLPSKPGHEVTRRLFHRYMENQIRGKQLISEGTLLSRVLMLAVSCTIALYYLRARTEEKEPTKEDLAWVFHLVETAISGHSNVFHDLFRQYEAAVLRELARA